MNIPVFVIGLSSVLLQVVCIRKLLSVFSGNELVISITLSVWIVAVGAGSRFGPRLKGRSAFMVSFIVISVLSQLTFLLLSFADPILKSTPGETVSLPLTFAFTAVSLFPLCFFIGAQFPLAVRYAGGRIPKVYGIEAGGAFAGGVVFSLILSGRVGSVWITALVGALNIATAVLLVEDRTRRLLLSVPAFIFVVFLSAFYGMRGLRPAMSGGMEPVRTIESRYGEISVTQLHGQYNIYSSGKFVFSYPDIQSDEMRTHLPMTLHKGAERVLLLGGSPSMLRELLKYPNASVDYIEIDPVLIKVSQDLAGRFDPGIFSDKRVRVVAEDARRFIKSSGPAGYDIILMNLPEPSTASINRYYTLDFFMETKKILKDDGMISLSMPPSSGYIGRRMQAANGVVYNSLRQVFSHVEPSSEEYGYMFASDQGIDTDPLVLEKRFNERAIRTGYFNPSLMHDAFSPLKTSMVRERLSSVRSVNTDMRPIAYLHNLRLWAELHGGRAIDRLLDLPGWVVSSAAALAGVAALALFFRKKTTVYYSLFASGFSTISFSVIVVLGYQSYFGYAYEMIGILTAVFMAGLSVGAYLAGRLTMPVRALRMFEVLSVFVIGMAILSIRSEYYYLLLNFLGGLSGGLVFSLVSGCITRQSPDVSGGRLYAVELSGSFAGCLITGLYSVPALGMEKALLLLVFFKMISIILLYFIGPEAEG